jgi:hypothetical protein
MTQSLEDAKARVNEIEPFLPTLVGSSKPEEIALRLQFVQTRILIELVEQLDGIASELVSISQELG